MYKCVAKNQWNDDSGYAIVSIREQDIDKIRLWRNAQMDVLRQQTQITEREQWAYFQEVIRPGFSDPHPEQILFSFLLHGECIGYGGLVHLNWLSKRGEVSFLVDPDRLQDENVYEKDFTHFLHLISQVAFDDLHFHRLSGETFAFRKHQIQILENFGFKREGILRDNILKKGKWWDSILHGYLAKDRQIPIASVLVTSISKKVPLLEAVRKAIEKFEYPISLHGSDCDQFCIGRYALDTFWHSPKLDHLTFEAILAYCHQHHVKAIIPTRDGELPFFAMHKNKFRQEGIEVMVSTPETIALCQDKKQFADVLIENHFPAIQTAQAITDLPNVQSFVVKEQSGAGSRGMALDLTVEEALAHANTLQHPIFQPFISGTEWSVDVYRHGEGTVLGSVARRRDVIVHGESQVTTTVANLPLEKLCQQLAAFLKIEGHAVFQVIEDENGFFHVIECNPRFGGASTASVAVGLTTFDWFLNAALEKNEDCIFLRSKQEIRQVRHPADWMIPWSS